MTSVEKVNKIFDLLSAYFDGAFHNDLWQIIVNESLKKDIPSAFIHVPVLNTGGSGIGIAQLNESGYIPTNFNFKNATLTLAERRDILNHLNDEVFGITRERADEIELSSYKKPMEKAKGDTRPVIYEYSVAVGQILTHGNSVVVALQVRVNNEFLPPTLHRVPSSKIARVIAQFHANLAEKEIRMSFPIETELKRPDWIEYVGRLNGDYFRPREATAHN